MNHQEEIDKIVKQTTQLEQNYAYDFTIIANSVFKNFVVPVCIERDWTFVSGMGTFVFYDGDDQVNLKHECRWLYEILMTPDIAGYGLGTWMGYYPEQ